MVSSPSTSSQKAPRFSLRTLILTATIFQVVLAVCSWNTAFGVALTMSGVGLLLIIIGSNAHRRSIVVLGCFSVLFAASYIAVTGLTVAAWTGRRKLDVRVYVVDASAITPVSEATIELLRGPNSPIEGLPVNVDRDFEVLEPSEAPRNMKTNELGVATFAHKFFAAGTDGLLIDSGYIDTRRNWLRVTARGYRTTYMPVDGQSTRSRNIHDTSPIFVTIPISKE